MCVCAFRFHDVLSPSQRCAGDRSVCQRAPGSWEPPSYVEIFRKIHGTKSGKHTMGTMGNGG